MPVDYTSVPVEDRKMFEDAFLDLLNLQTMSIYSCSFDPY